MEFLLVLIFLVLAIVLINRTGAVRRQIEGLERSLDRLASMLEQRGPAPAGTATPTDGTIDTTLPSAAVGPDIVRDTHAVETPPLAPEPEVIPTAPAVAATAAEPLTPPAESAGRTDTNDARIAEDSPAFAQADATASGDELSQPAPSRTDFSDLEKRFGTQWVVWVGGIALALGGILLVRYSIEQGLFTPGLRVIAGAALALLLVGLGELARRRENAGDIAESPRGAHIPSILTAAGTTAAYADVWAAYELYDFLSPGVAFLLLGLVAIATLGAALLHGPALGGLGLVGAYVTPLLVSTTQPNYWALYVYIAVVTAAAYALASFRSWRWLTITAVAFSVAWSFVGMADPRPGSLPAHAFSILTGFALAATFLVPGIVLGGVDKQGKIGRVPAGALIGYLIAAFALVVATVHTNTALITLIVLAAATAAIAWRSDSAVPAVPVAALLTVLVVVHWSVNFNLEVLWSPAGPLFGAPPTWTLSGRNQHILFAAGAAAVFGLAGYWSQARSTRLEFAMVWAATAVLTPVLILISLFYSLAGYGRSFSFAAMALGLTALFAIAALRLSQREPREGTPEASAIFATGAVAALALALTFALEKGWLTVALSLMVPGIAFIEHRQPLPILRKLCGALILLVTVRIALDPQIVGDDVGKTPILNWLLWGYGVPAAAFWFGSRILRWRADDLPARMAESAAILFAALTAMLEIRHLMNDGDIFRPKTGLGEMGLQISIWLAMAIGFERQRERSGSIIHDFAARTFGALAILGSAFALLIGHNPVLTGESVGGRFFNFVLLGYGVPALLMAILARVIRGLRGQAYYLIAAVLAMILALLYLTLEVRTLFHGPVLSAPIVWDAEHYSYSVVWLGFGVALLLAGVALQSQPARLASAAVVVLTILKVFLHDLRGVEGLWRALSIICLGLTLMGIGWLYQRLLFPARRPPPEAPA